MGEGPVTGKRVSLESARTDPPVGIQRGSSAKWGSADGSAFMGLIAKNGPEPPCLPYPVSTRKGAAPIAIRSVSPERGVHLRVTPGI
jgi:hypothetical protein